VPTALHSNDMPSLLGDALRTRADGRWKTQMLKETPAPHSRLRTACLLVLALAACSQASAPEIANEPVSATPTTATRAGASSSTPATPRTGNAGTPAPTTAAQAGTGPTAAAGGAGQVANEPTAGSVAAGAGSGGSVAGAAAAGTGAASAGNAAPASGDGTMQDAKSLVAQFSIGWNLGNSLDAVGGETAWGNPMVTPALIQAVAAAGFKVVRVPVTWAKHFGAGPTFTIEPAWLKRVEEIVSYVTDTGMYAIINVHHDGAEGGDGEWLSLRDSSGSANAAHDMAVQAQFVALWKQIATHFANHGDKLLFESMNEIKVGYEKPDPAYYKPINALNQVFVDTVRATGGNNATRCLVVPGYNTNIEYTLAGFTAPTDPAPGRLILSVHYYDPWSFAGSGETHAWGMGSPGADNWGQEAHADAQFEMLKTTYVSAGLPVIIGEYGAVHQDSAANYRRYYMEYVTKAAVDRGIIPVYWDNGGKNSGADGFGLFDRASNQSLYPEVLQAMMRAATEDYPSSAIAKP
jgi:endoglucanase